MKGTNKTENGRIDYVCEVIRAKEVKEGRVAFDMKVNGVTVYGCWYVEGVKDGNPYTIVNLPQYKAENGKYYSHAWFPMSNEVKQNIIEQLEQMV